MKQVWNKLVRDKIPEIIEQNGEKVVWRVLADSEYREELKKKLLEESQEVLGAGDDKKELAKEIGDVIEVIDYLVKAFELDKEDVEKIKNERRQKRGGFDKKIFLEYTE